MTWPDMFLTWPDIFLIWLDVFLTWPDMLLTCLNVSPLLAKVATLRPSSASRSCFFLIWIKHYINNMPQKVIFSSSQPIHFYEKKLFKIKINVTGSNWDKMHCETLQVPGCNYWMDCKSPQLQVESRGQELKWNCTNDQLNIGICTRNKC